MKRIAVFGGTFNPVHNGHIRLCRACREQFSFDKILFVPTNLPPHKNAPDLASNADRLRMLELALSEEPDFVPCDMEYRLGGKSYTVDTLSALVERFPGGRLTLILGADMLFTFREWREWERILTLADLLAGARREEDFLRLCGERDSYGALAKRITVLRYPPEDISSTQIREALRQGREISLWLPAKVETYIREKGLYV